MKKLFCYVSTFILILLTFCVNVYAIDFDAENVYKSVVIVYSEEFVGSGFSIGDNLIITNAHVIENSNKVKVSIYKDKLYDVKVLSMDEDLDIAVLQIDDIDIPYLEIKDYNDEAVGADVYAVGIPQRMSYTLTKGILSSKERIFNDSLYLQTDASVNSGNSGGPLINEKGEVIGVNTLKIVDSEGIGLAIPMTRISEYIIDNDIKIVEQKDIIEQLAEKSKIYNKNVTEKDYFNNDIQDEQSKINELKDINFKLKIALVFFVITNIITLILLFLHWNDNKKSNNKRNKHNNDDYDFEIEIQE